MALVLVVCPTCDYTGAGDGYGPSGAGGACPDCRGTGEVTPTRRLLLLARSRRGQRTNAPVRNDDGS